jgi:uncharacterized protein (TIGR03435 family)
MTWSVPVIALMLPGFLLALAQSQPPTAFDLASVRRNAGSRSGPTIQTSPDGLTLRGVTLGFCIRWAYGLRPYNTYQTVGPDWIDPPRPEFYDIEAKADRPWPKTGSG